ncbi:MAG: hypothetical protein AAFY34_06415 [Pseudomonadota bacterium]
MKTILITATALAVSVMPTAIAETGTPEVGVPYTITFDGDHYPPGLEMIEYPYAAGRLRLSGQCRLNVHVDGADTIATMTIASCTDDRFRDASRRFIGDQEFEGSLSSDLRSYPLVISWAMDPQEPEIIIATN